MIKYLKKKLILRVLLSMMAATLIIYLISIVFISDSAQKSELKNSEKIVDLTAQDYANKISSELNIDVGISRGMALTFSNYHENNFEKIVANYNKIMIAIITANPQFYSIWTSWELNAVNEKYTQKYGRIRYTYFRENEKIKYKLDSVNLTGDNKQSLYYQIKIAKKEAITDPYFFSYNNKKEDEILESSICIPILYNNKFAGLAGVDVSIDRFVDLVEHINPFEKSYSFLLSNNGIVLAHPDKSYIGKSINDVYKSNKSENYISKIQQGITFSVNKQDSISDGSAYIAFAPIIIGKSDKPWSLAIVVPQNEIKKEALQSKQAAMLLSIVGILVLSILIWLITKSVTGPIKKLTFSLKEIAVKGNLNEEVKVNICSSDELGDMAKAVNSVVDTLKTAANFAQQVGKGNLNALHEPLSKQDILGNSLLEMKESLLKAKMDENIRKQEEENRNWATAGYALFGEILRKNNDDLNALTTEIVKNIVNYTGCNQGGLFLLNEEDKTNVFLELISCFAFNRQKCIEKKVLLGEGLIGSCFLEKQTIFMTDVPKNYINITSGLGEDNPRCILIVPLKLYDVIYGVIEIASFKVLQSFEVEFIEKVGESIASTISSVKINISTASLLSHTQQQAEEMRAQEEEMRQNLEELHAAQEEMIRNESEMHSILDAVNNSLIKAEYTRDGTFISANEKFLEIVESKFEDIKNKNITMFIPEEEQARFKASWEKVLSGKFVSGVVKRKTSIGKTLYILLSYTPVKSVDGEISKVLYLGQDITKQKEIELLLLEEQEKQKKYMEEKNNLYQEMERRHVELKEYKDSMAEEAKAQKEMIQRKLEKTIEELKIAKDELALLKQK